MKSIFIKILVTILVISGLCALLQFSGILSCTYISTNNLMPSLKKGGFVFSSGIKSYTYNNIVCFKSKDFKTGKSTIEILRIAGMPGDTIELNDGYLLRNGFFADDINKLMFRYDVKKKLINDSQFFKKLLIYPEIEKDTVHFYLSKNEFKTIGMNYLLHKYHSKINFAFCNKASIDNSDNKNQFACLIIVPEDSCFLLGDNRDQCVDSRDFGFVASKNIISTILFLH